jgi:hypothetical protein
MLQVIVPPIVPPKPKPVDKFEMEEPDNKVAPGFGRYALSASSLTNTAKKSSLLQRSGSWNR